MEIFLYLIKVNVSIAIFYGLYRLFFGRDTFFRLKRVALLLTLSFSVLYPLMNMPEMWTSSKTWTELTTNNALTVYLDEVIITPNPTAQGFSITNLLTFIYFLCIGLLVTIQPQI